MKTFGANRTGNPLMQLDLLAGDVSMAFADTVRYYSPWLEANDGIFDEIFCRKEQAQDTRGRS